ncbi:hypothetical protein HQR03_11660 [Psychrobacter okhotskensis]|uniref:hypothetical protein n=1 Tax=Psychrobacter TaxID=497 RepID=UPI000C3339F4|nr:MULTISPECIES: hypothetical protein [Psychrobacter]NRD71191.1 hypothetical protein [Psychrobacter okhotskensis]PKG35465.1 hypothetical protein CXF65_07285 [Psychrobacter sp. Sarcosine-3u-12]
MIQYQRRSVFSTVLICASTVLISVTGCSYSTVSQIDNTVKSKAVVQTPAVQKIVGDYASNGYATRKQGSDWVGVIVRADGAADIAIKVRARSDVKKPTCQFDAKATLLGQDDAHGIIFQTKINNSNDSMAFFQFKEDTLTIDSQDKYALNYFCSGGGTLAGNYEKLEGNLELN